MTNSRRVAVAMVAVVALAGLGAGATAASADFQDGPYEATQTETATLTVAVNDTETAHLSVGSESVGYQLNATLVDENGDGTVTVEFRVPNAGTDDQTLAAVGDDAVENVSENEFNDPPLAPGAYRLTASDDGGQASDVSRLQIQEASETTDEPATTAEPETTEAPATTEDATTENASNGDSPGFGAVAALVAVAGAALLAARR